MKHRRKEFYPDYLLEILVVIFLTVELAAMLALVFPVPVGRRIDFSLPFSPKPEWYFLWLYELIRYFPGRWVGIGSVLIPGAALLLLLAIPFIDRSRRGRLLAVAVGLALAGSVVILTILAVAAP